jgi:hypothetical protein
MPIHSSPLGGDALALEHGVRTLHEQMPNGELRFRLIAPDGSSYVRTVAGSQGAWQNSHYHNQLRETYIVEAGWIVIAELNDKTGSVDFTRYARGDIITSPIKGKHNVYMAARSVIHTVKHGGLPNDPDWHPASALDAVTLRISEEELLEKITNRES